MCQRADSYLFSKVFGTHKSFLIFTFASQRRLLELLSYGEYNQLSISVICFLKTTLLSVFIHLFFFSCRIKSTHIIFLPFKNINHINRALKHWIIYIWINFSLVYSCKEILLEVHKILKLLGASLQRFCHGPSW